MRYGNKTTLFEQLDWWERQYRGSFNLDLYLKVCRAKRNQVKPRENEKETKKLQK